MGAQPFPPTSERGQPATPFRTSQLRGETLMPRMSTEQPLSCLRRGDRNLSCTNLSGRILLLAFVLALFSPGSISLRRKLFKHPLGLWRRFGRWLGWGFRRRFRWGFGRWFRWRRKRYPGARDGGSDYFSTTDFHRHPHGWYRNDFLVRGWSGERQCCGRRDHRQ